MPAWSPFVANELIRLARDEGRTLDQVQLQKLVYIAHGWCLASTGQPLTGDRPEAWRFGPVYRRISEALTMFGLDPIDREIAIEETGFDRSGLTTNVSELDAFERDLVRQVYQDFGRFSRSELSNLTRRGDAPWTQVYADGAGEWRDIPHALIRAQFVDFFRNDAD